MIYSHQIKSPPLARTHVVRSKMTTGVVAWGDADSGGDCSWLSAELQDVQVLNQLWPVDLWNFWRALLDQRIVW